MAKHLSLPELRECRRDRVRNLWPDVSRNRPTVVLESQLARRTLWQPRPPSSSSAAAPAARTHRPPGHATLPSDFSTQVRPISRACLRSSSSRVSVSLPSAVAPGVVSASCQQLPSKRGESSPSLTGRAARKAARVHACPLSASPEARFASRRSPVRSRYAPLENPLETAGFVLLERRRLRASESDVSTVSTTFADLTRFGALVVSVATRVRRA